MIELTRTYVTYQGQSKLLELATEIAETKNLNKVRDDIVLAGKIRLYLKALQYYTYLEKPAIDRLVYVLADLCDANALPYSPSITSVDPPGILVGIPGAQGEQGEQGDEGGGVPFSLSGITIDSVVDSFAISESRGVEYTVNIYDDSGSDMRILRIQGGWSSDGLTYADDGGMGQTIQGDCSGISLSIIVSGGTTAQLFATVTSGTWIVEGTRKYVPNNGNGITTPTTLASGKIWVGNASGTPTAVTPSGDATITTTGVVAIASGVIVNADINASAAIAVSKLATLTASRAVVTDSSGVLTVSDVTSAEVGYLDGVTSNIQTQLDAKIDSADGAISTVVSTNLTASRALISNPSGKIAVSAVTSTELAVLDGLTATTTELNYVDGVTSAIQTQINAKQATITGAATTITGSDLTVSRALVSNSSGKVAVSSVTSTELGYVSGVTSAIQTQIDSVSTGVFVDDSIQLRYKVVAIGAWNMVSSVTKTTAHGLSDHTVIRDAVAVIVSDLGGFSPLARIDASATGNISGSVTGWDATNISMMRYTGGTYDSTNYDSTGASRGWLLIAYEG